MTAPAEDAPDFTVVLPWSEDRDGLWLEVLRVTAEFQAGGATQTTVEWSPRQQVRVVGWRDGDAVALIDGVRP